MDDELKKLLDESYNNKDDNDKSFVDPNDLINITPEIDNSNSSITNEQSNIKNDNINVITTNNTSTYNNSNQIINTSIDSNNIMNNDSKEKKNKKKLVSLPILIFIIICIFIIIGIFVLDYIKENKEKDIPINSNNSTNKPSNVIKKDNSNIYGYAILSYRPEDSLKEFYKIVELNNKEGDKTLISYDVSIRDAVNQPRNIDTYSAKIVNNKFYYILNYNLTVDGLYTYNSIMCIDLNSEEKVPYEVFNWKQDLTTIKKIITDFKVTNDYIYFSTGDSNLFYKYDFSTNEVLESTSQEFSKIKGKEDNKYKRLNNIKKYYYGKEIYVENNNKLIYDDKIVYTAPESALTLYYSFYGDIVISEGYNCENISCDTIKYFKLDITSGEKQELDYNSRQIFSQIIWHKENKVQ